MIRAAAWQLIRCTVVAVGSLSWLTLRLVCSVRGHDYHAAPTRRVRSSGPGVTVEQTGVCSRCMKRGDGE